MLTSGEIPLPKQEYACSFLCDLIHLRTAKALAVYGEDFYAGMPCVTQNRFGQGTAYYIGTQPENAFLTDLLDVIFSETGLHGAFDAEPGVEITRRVNEQGETVFVLNHEQAPREVDFGETALINLLTGERVTGKKTVAARDVMILKANRRGE